MMSVFSRTLEELGVVKSYPVMERKGDVESFWRWNGNKKKHEQFSVTKLLGNNKPPKPQTSVLGPGFGAGIGCGAGLGFGLLGGVGYGPSSPFNHLHLLFGLGFGCGVAVGFGFGQGIRYHFHFRTRKSTKSTQHFTDPHKTIVIQI
ncbi:hypothetical protein VNO78_14699 [Psophocarpus tetragonolobus]|uniref:Uncharacterized protein n=1 Tax=Psophocarpus tetragonolobus TaxID=3891 RepID=A0AAN9SH68_PSOTE